tara:strand:+ start:1110 stop:1907 length:798 start_codon:yes stop_codon:yes gene_type:complete
MENKINIKSNECKRQYQFKNIDFLVSTYINRKNLVIFFHGGRCGATLPIFRGYDYTFDDTNILSFSDPLLKYYNTNIGWYLNTTKHPSLRNDIISIINKIKDITQPSNLIFVAQCSGVLIAVELACIFNEYVFITNPHLIVKSDDCKVYDSWTDTRSFNIYNNTKYYPLETILKENKESIITYDDLDIRNAFINHGIPKHITIYAHNDDYTTEWIVKVKEFYIKINKLDKCDIVLHKTNCKSPHHCPLPNNASLKEYLKLYISKL